MDRLYWTTLMQVCPCFLAHCVLTRLADRVESSMEDRTDKHKKPPLINEHRMDYVVRALRWP